MRESLLDAAFIVGYFTVAVGFVLAVWLVLDRIAGGSTAMRARLESSVGLVCLGGVVMFLSGLLVAFIGYGFGDTFVTRTACVAMAIAVPIVLAAEHVGQWRV